MKTSFIRHIRVQPYGWHLYLFDDREKWAKFVARKTHASLANKRRDCADGTTGITHVDYDAKILYIGVFDGEIGTLAHEMTHAGVFVLDHAGIEAGASDGETLAYLIGHLMDECVQKVLKLPVRKTP